MANSDVEEGTLANHLEHLAADADDLSELLSRSHESAGDIHPDALGRSEKLATNLRAVIDALGKHEHLAMGADDVWAMLTREHRSGSGTLH